MSSYAKMKSSAVKGAPSDHFIPLCMVKVYIFLSADMANPCISSGTILPSSVMRTMRPPRSGISVMSCHG